MTPRDLVHLALRPGEWRTAASLRAGRPERQAPTFNLKEGTHT